MSLRSSSKTKKISTIRNISSNNARPPEAILIMYREYAKVGDNDATLNSKQVNKCKCVKYEVRNNEKTGLMDRDIELKKCNKPVKPGTDFCDAHQNCLGYLRNFVNGFEPPYEPNAWAHPYIEGSHNCYAYFLDDRKQSIAAKCEEFCLKNNKEGCPKKDDDCQNLIPQPGHSYKYKKNNSSDQDRIYSCPNMINKVLADNPTIRPARLTDKCPANYYKGAMVVDRGNTFHFYRQNKDATWSHKPGILPVTNIDADGKQIYIPHFANRNYSKDRDEPIVYNDFCGYFCIPTNAYFETSLA